MDDGIVNPQNEIVSVAIYPIEFNGPRCFLGFFQA